MTHLVEALPAAVPNHSSQLGHAARQDEHPMGRLCRPLSQCVVDLRAIKA